ncbi:MAG TPA: ParA family protein [Candidatus Saccharimonadales bacterium]|nr:ParA family protein [Candidatus Saccharimonadales bacterium]
MNHIVAVINQKGGVGKTTTTINLAAYLARSGRSVLVVDADPQGNSTSGLGLDKRNLDSTLYDVLFNRAEVSNSIRPTNTDGIFIIPSNANLAAAEIELAAEVGRELKLRQILSNLEYDYILIDCPPSLGLLSINGLAAASDALVPVQTEYYAMEGLSLLIDTINKIKQAINPGLNLLGIVLTMYDSRTSLAEQVEAEVKKHFSGKVFNTVIPRNVRLAEAPSFGRTIIEHDKWSKGARAYKALAKELEKRLNG